MKRFFGISKNFLQAMVLASLLCATSSVRTQAQTVVKSQQAQLMQQLDEAKSAVQLRPDDAHAHYAYGEALHKCGKYRQAACEYLDAVDLDSTMYVAFHQIAQIKCDSSQIDEALTYLLELDEDRPNDLMLKIALSELLERKEEYYKAARALIDVSYAEKLPPKLAPRLKARIHYLLAKSRQDQNDGKTFASTSTPPKAIEDDETSGMPPPLPDNMPTRPLTSGDMQNGRTTEGTGHSTLLQ
jgi:tetratricopeptide (TPR) repeat protein